MKLTRIPNIWDARWFGQVWDQLLGDSATLAGHIAATDPHPDLIDDVDAAVSVALTDKVLVSQSGTNRAASVTQIAAALPTLPLSGSGSPEGAVVAAVGTLYLNTAGGASTTLYVKTSGTGNTGWTAK